MEPDAAEVTRFVDAARAFCRFVCDSGSYGPGARLLTAAHHLATLYAAALSLPPAEPSTSTEEPSVEKPPWVPFEGLDVYWEVYEPLVQVADSDAVVAGSLSEDILDIYMDVARGLAYLEAGLVADAVWHWRFTRETHWGDHAVDALRALQRAMRA